MIYMVVFRGVMESLTDAPNGKPEWIWDNPAAAAVEFARKHPEFDLEEPAWLFNESELSENVTHWPGGWLKRKE